MLDSEKGARLEVKNKQGLTPMDIAMGKVAGGGQPRAPRESTVGLLKQLTPAAEAPAGAAKP